MERSRERSCWSLTLESASWQKHAHAFYEHERLTNMGRLVHEASRRHGLAAEAALTAQQPNVSPERFAARALSHIPRKISVVPRFLSVIAALGEA